MKYSEALIYYFHHREHAGRLEQTIASVRHAQIGNAENQEVLALYVDYQDQIVEAKFQATGSVVLIAGGEYICRWLEKKTWADLTKLTPEIILQGLGLTAINIHVANIIIMAIQKLLELK